MLQEVQVKVLDQRIGRQFPELGYCSQDAAGLDLIACLDQPYQLMPQETLLVPTGIAIYIQNNAYAAKILPRSGLGHKKGIVLGNSVGLIDADYQGPLMVSCFNRSREAYVITPGERIAQLIFIPIQRPNLITVSEFTATSERGTGGFGSTGRF
ncbi:MAG: dUTP diphosphatase [Legionellales bacterium]|nr:dUTP diphosphatase [Legionellales bacterium]|tara:strand:- start:2385 stop:2846 length:462 start_codon:yes stop_codon:yes gene_type:complete